MIPYWHSTRLWELVEQELQDRDVALTTASRHVAGNSTLFDYILATSATLRDGLRSAGQFFHLVSSNARLQVEAETEREATYSLQYLDGDGRGRETLAALARRLRISRRTLQRQLAEHGTTWHAVSATPMLGPCAGRCGAGMTVLAPSRKQLRVRQHP